MCPSSETPYDTSWPDGLRSIRWAYFLTPTFRQGITEWTARWRFHEWLSLQPQWVVGERWYAAVAFERGLLRERTHLHVLLGGFARHPLRRGYLTQSWEGVHGGIQVVEYDPRLDPSGTVAGASAYLTKTGSDAVELIGHPVVRWRRRKRRRGAK